MKSCETHQTTQQSGFVLISAMLFLVVLTILVISLMRTSILEERMISNTRDWNVAFQAAESALRDAEREIIAGIRINGETGFVSGCSSSSDAKGAGLCLPNLCTDTSASGDCSPIWEELEIKQNDTGWISGANSGKSIAYGDITGASSLNVSGSQAVGALPRYIIEVLKIPNAASLKTSQGQPEQKYVYRVTAVGFGKSTTTRVMLQGNYRQY
ncbi:pilus assembly PilX family protein [Propionivibrio limicola]|uniref:pilus assembly PilX family protein n=1 Tax=Propionivibrio limicola TaxID=167645 RepID=UPI00129119F6|nr:pilus assembly protein [Propionivibrio limicola]